MFSNIADHSARQLEEKVFIACVVVSIVLAAMLVASAVLKFTYSDHSVKVITGLGVPLSWFPFLGAAELAGAVGLVAGLAFALLGIAAAVGVIVYFVGAVVTHLRVGDRDIASALMLGAFAVVARVLRVVTM